jgi:transposase
MEELKMAKRYKGKNRQYEYETHNKWNKEKKKYETKWTYIGKVDPTTKIAAPVRVGASKPESLIVDYGNTFILAEYCRLSGFMNLIEVAFGELANILLALVFYRLIEDGGMNMAGEWYRNNYARVCFPCLDLASQRISEYLVQIGNESLWRKFFVLYTQSVYSNNGVVIDSTGLTNDIDISLTALGHHGGEVAKEIRMIMVVDRISGEPLYFRYVAGNIVDVSTLKTTMNELTKLNINANYALLDAGYCSEENIRALYNAQISFLMRVPSGRKVFKESVEKAVPALETIENCVLFGERVLYIKQEKIELCNPENFQGYAYVCLDVKKRAEDITRIMTEALTTKEAPEKTKEKLKTAGIFALISPENLAGNEVLQLYYLRQSAEQIFELSKSYADILPLRVHKEETLRGILMINFIAVAIYKSLNKQLPDNIPLSNALKFMRTQRAKVYEDNSLSPSEPNKRQRLIMEAVSNTVGKFSGA